MSEATVSQSPRGGLFRGAALMASGTAVSRALGFVRTMVLVAAVGVTGQAADAFAVANKLPNVLYMLLAGGALNAVLVPQVVRAYKRDAGQEYVDRLLTLGFALLAGSTLLLTVASPLLVRLYADPGDPAQVALATAFAYWCVPQMFFYGVYGLLGQVLNARGSFGPYMWAPVVNNVVSIVGFLLFIAVFGGATNPDVSSAAGWSGLQIGLLAGAATLGIVAQALVLVPALRATGVSYRPRWGLRGSGLGRAGSVATWTFAGLAIGQIGYVVVSRVASAAPQGSTTVAGNAAYDLAFVLFMLPHSLVTVSLATALFTRLSAQATDRDADAARATFSVGVRVVGVFTLVATALLVVLAEPLTRIVLLGGAGVDAAAPVVAAMAVGLPAFGAWSMCQRVFYAYEDAKGMVPIQVVMAAVVVGGTYLGRALLPSSGWVVGIGLAMSASYVVGAALAMLRLRGHLGTVDAPAIVRTHLLAGLAAAAAFGAGWGARRLLDDVLGSGVGDAALECLAVSAAVGLVYLAALRLLRVRELDLLAGPLLRKLGRGGSRPV
ncbi:murein biosynthesis integral membrane protein MurJ [Cellulomonas oligotrophica]|uniref:Lipid II flippase MurJ n=1 Tax=Cellulomonas oligotrophica TaxID=931536 RepID=A0A7Y9FFY5_9CELL|nr:murein biosynthesis integral membrane protein MurJ [Cellulomonas oligotrophica]NYD86636.1 putative peptidoglycan lipid II flippase [Cellulomonas oligotrophica]GIG34385.1 lipid II flippase MurJ [Cellulomonas oligotrophica]